LLKINQKNAALARLPHQFLGKALSAEQSEENGCSSSELLTFSFSIYDFTETACFSRITAGVATTAPAIAPINPPITT
jgi:hypothetical protein